MEKAVSGPAYRIQTTRLVVRCWDPKDAPLLKQAIDDNIEHLLPWMTWARQEPEPLQAKVDRLRLFRGKFDLGQDFAYGVFSPDETAVLGAAGLHTRLGEGAREIGYWIHRGHLNRGLATEVAAALTRTAFELDRVDRVEIRCDPQNARSAAVPRKLGFALEATLRRRLPQGDGNLRDTMIWSLFKTEYPASPAAAAVIQAFDAAGRRII
ncbi:MAG: GNAT family N-acetyltransferase [Anaerolineales bacterium]|nr:GNAT family N-acetyltransferase [Anaerolineales bacterium]